MPRIRKRYIALILFGVIAAGALVWVRSYIFESVGKGLNERMQSLRVSGFNVRYDSIRIDWRRNVVELNNVVVEKNAYDTTCIYPEFVSVRRVRAEGLGLLQLVFRKVLSLETLYLDSVRIVVRQNSLLKLDSTAQRKNELTLKVDELYLRSADIVYTDSAHCNSIAGIKSHLSLKGLHIDFHLDKPFTYEAESMVFDSVEMSLPSEYYTFKVRQAAWNGERKAFRADSIKIIPDFSKAQFSRKHGIEIDRYEGVIPYLAASGISLPNPDSLHLNIGLAEIQFRLKIFRDKRLPFVSKKKPLPIDQLREIPFSLQIDSLKVLNSFVQYEEFAEGTSEPGGVFFEGLSAVLTNVSNTAVTGNLTLASRARLFGEGDITLYATFPFDRRQRSSVEGAVRDFNLPRLNAILTPSTQLQVESGNMEELLFKFTFNDTRSDGEITLQYQNLKLVTFKEQDAANSDEPEVDNFKTFMMNVFVFRKNMPEDLPEEKRKGTIAFVRLDDRSIFNFWSKSLISGIKSAYKLDKSAAVSDSASTRKKSDKALKKEERALKREARKQRRMARKRDRG